MQTFFKRLLHIVESQGFKNINDFALNGLKYDSSSKLNRLKDEKNKPSVEIILDIASQFPNINTHWLLTGNGNSFLNTQENESHYLNEPKESYPSDASELLKNVATLKENLLLKEDIIKSLKEKIEVQQKQIIPLEAMIKKLENRIHSLEQFSALAKEKLDIK